MARAAVIADASGLIALQQIEELSLLEKLFGEILIPPAVAREVAPGLASLPPWIQVCALGKTANERVLAANLGAGETEVLGLALEREDAWLILDDAPARRLAGALSLKVLGTAAVLLQAKQASLIPRVRPLLDALLANGFRLSPKVYQTILAAAGETAFTA
jgi:predicted nucleic acid-binding protein